MNDALFSRQVLNISQLSGESASKSLVMLLGYLTIGNPKCGFGKGSSSLRYGCYGHLC